ncbi:MAG: DUF5916 domain-containing protein [Acidobacteria bacterium]|nr:DUF5916 domain-containing protein [Acidobacteriota bacterium]
MNRSTRGRLAPFVLACIAVLLPAAAWPQEPVDTRVIAVAPFTNVSGAADEGWIGRGIAETLAATLEGVGARVVLVEASDDAAVAAARSRGASRVVAGGYQRLGDRLRITGRLIDTSDRRVVHSAIVDGLATELFALQDRLAAALQGALREGGADGAMGGPESPARGPGRTDREPRLASPALRAATATAAAATTTTAAVTTITTSGGGGSLGAGLRAIDGPAAPAAPATLARDGAGRATVRSVRLTGPWRLDGVLDEAIYAEVPPVDGFIQQLPEAGLPPTEETDAWVFHDDDNLYVAARLWDSEPDGLIANEMQRDSFQLVNNDFFSVGLDTFYDRRNGVTFLVNAIGGFMDFAITDEDNPNMDWNAIWDVRTGRFDGGWTVEMEVPFKSLRFPAGPSQTWGLHLGRNVRRKSETSFLTPVPINAFPGQMRLSAAGTLTGVEVPEGNRVFEVKPYAIGSVATDVNAVPRIDNEGDGNAGLDVKYGVTQNLTADFTYNTDFAQVEVDEQQVNLTRFNLFFPEKREFFLEGQGIFDFGRPAGIRRRPGGRRQTGPRGGGVLDSGDVPTVFFSRRIGLERDDDGISRTVPITAGGRMTGKAGPFSIGALNIQTGAAAAVDARSTNFTVLRVKRDILRRSRIGGIFTGRSVSTDRVGSNEAYGLDAAFSFYDNVHFNGYYARTRTPDRVGDDASYQAAFNYAGDRYGFQLDHLLVGDNFNPEIGFLRRDDFRRTYALARFSPRPAALRAVRQFTWEAGLDYIENGAGEVETRLLQGRFDTELENSDRFGVDLQDSRELLVDPFRITPDVTIPVGLYDFRDVFVSYSMGEQRRVAGTWSLQRGSFFSGDLTAVGYSRGRIEITPRFSLEPSVSVNRITLPEGAFTATLVTSRVTYTFTPRMFFGGLVQYSSTGSLLATNLRLRWEYQPGSELFVVYNDQRDTALRPTPFLQNRAFIVKLTRLFRF